MRKGHLQRTVPVLIVVVLALPLLASQSLAQHKGAFAGRTFSNALVSLTQAVLPRPIIGHTLPVLATLRGGNTMTAKGSGPDPDQDLTPNTPTWSELQPNASPGTTQNRIAFSSNKPPADDQGVVPTTPGDYNLWLMRSDGSEQQRITSMSGDEVDPVYDPSGNLLAFCAQVNGTWQIFTVQIADTTVIQQITSGPGNKRHPTWSPSSNFIAFSGDAQGNWDLYRVASTGAGAPVQLTFGTTNDTDPAWSPAGGQIAFTRATGTVKRIYSIDEDGGNLTQLSDGGGSPTASDQEPAWRPTAAELAFASNRFTDATDTRADFNIWRMSAAGEIDGADPTLVSNTTVTDTADDTNPAWTVNITRAPSRIVFESNRSGSADLWAYQLTDWLPPTLQALPSVDNRVTTPGSDVQVSVPVYDQDSGVASVFASFKDPETKLYLQNWWGSSFDANFGAGECYLERDCATVGTVELTDDDNDGVFTGAWTTGLVARDYIIDITVTDNAGNSLKYDDVYGFSTKTFAPSNPVLFVDDYCEGQLFLAQLGYNNDFTAAWPVESYWRRNPSYYPGVESTIDFDTIAGGTGTNYDVWRVICRGPVTSSVYQYYLPTVEYQLDPAKLDNTGSIGVVADRAVPVAQRAIVWAAPHTGDVWTADGTILDASTQADVALFIRRGGRMLMSGENLGYALTMNGTQSNTFFSSTLRATYVQDVAYPNASVAWGYLGQWYVTEGVSDDFGVGGLAGDVVAQDPWGGFAHVGTFANWYDSGDNPVSLNSARVSRPTNSPWFLDAAQFSYRPDVIAPLDAIQIYGYGADEGGSATGPGAGLRYEDTTTGNGGKMVYLAFGLEQINRGYHSPTNLPSHCENHRSHLIHNALCWERTGGFQGRVISISDGGQPIGDPNSDTDPSPIVSAIQGGVVKYAVRCQKDGTFIMQGLAPGSYTMAATRPGYEVDHYEGSITHGGGAIPIVDFAIKRSEPGAVTGTVSALAGTTTVPLANVTVSIAPAETTTTGVQATALPDPVLTAADGTYTLASIPPGDYVVTADGTAVEYSVEENQVTVNPGDTTTSDFTLTAAQGTLAATVTDSAALTALANAKVTIRQGGTKIQDAYTDNQGKTNLNLDPGTYDVTVGASGYQDSAPQSVTITPADTTVLAVGLTRLSPGSLAGRVVAKTSGNFIGAVTIIVKYGDQEVARTTTRNTAVTTYDGVSYNFVVSDVPTGEVTVVAERSGFTPEPAEYADVLVQSSQTTYDVNFTMQSMHSFPAGLQLVSLPWDYSAVDPATLLGVNTSTFKMATYETTRARYRIYPDAPADRFRLGNGYWMNLSSPTDLAQEGNSATDPVELALAAGWNLLGTPYNQRIDFYLTTVRRVGETQEYTLQQALGQGIIGSGLFAYALGGYQSTGIMAPYIGYWLKVNEPCYLTISASAGALAVGAAADRSGVTTPANGWLLGLKACGNGVQDESAFCGVSPAATDGFDNGLDQAKPPLPAMGAYLNASFADSQWNPADQAVDVRAAGRDTVWNLRVQTNLVGQKVTLLWPNMTQLPKSARPVLTDLATGQQIFMRTSNGYTFTARSEETRLQISLEGDGAGQLVVAGQGATNTAAGAAVTYSLSRAANIEAHITNLAGRTVRVLAGSNQQTAGTHTLLWDGRADSGLRAPSGRYLVTISATTAAGQASRAVVPVNYRPQ